MIEGVVNAALEAVVPLRVQGPAGRTREVQAVVDTGYSGFLTLPAGLVIELGLPFAYMGQALLANVASRWRQEMVATPTRLAARMSCLSRVAKSMLRRMANSRYEAS